VIMLFYCGKHPLHPWICSLLPSVLTPFWAWSFPILQRGPNDEVLVQRHLLLARRRRFLLSILLYSSAVYMSATPRHFFVYRTSLLLLTLVTYMLNGNFLWIDFLARPSFWWNRRLICLTKTVLRWWGVAASFALLSPLSPRVFWWLEDNLTTITQVLVTHHIFVGHAAT
jgi:hypothetical protein